MSDDRLSPLDASFLHVEDASSHMHVACVMVFDGDAPPYEAFLEHIDRRLGLVPRYRQRLAEVPLAQARPRWVDDERFDLRYHVRATALPGDAGDEELRVLAGRVFSQHLRRDRPLWEMWLVDNVSDGRFAVLSKTHHALIDGVSGLDILSVLFSPEEANEQHWRPRPTPSDRELLAEALADRASSARELLRPVRALLRGPRQAATRLAETAVAAGAFSWAGLQPAPPTPYNAATVGPDRRFQWVRGSLAEAKVIKNELGGTVNDVVLATVSGGVRRHLIRRGVDVEGLTLKAFVPVSLRGDDEHELSGNKVSGMIAPLPVSCSDPVECLQRISAAMHGVKNSGQIAGAQALTELTALAPPAVVQQVARSITRQRFVNLVVTNVPGPQFALHFAGRELRDIFPMVPLGKNLTFGVAIVSYNGTLDFGLVGDFNAMYDLDDVARDFAAAHDELATAAGLTGRNAEPVGATNGASPRSDRRETPSVR
jgi:diacylglycerol O-acyltransferase / wax synthase